jgi:hypothetical protein
LRSPSEQADRPQQTTMAVLPNSLRGWAARAVLADCCRRSTPSWRWVSCRRGCVGRREVVEHEPRLSRGHEPPHLLHAAARDRRLDRSVGRTFSESASRSARPSESVRSTANVPVIPVMKRGNLPSDRHL